MIEIRRPFHAGTFVGSSRHLVTHPTAVVNKLSPLHTHRGKFSTHLHITLANDKGKKASSSFLSYHFWPSHRLMSNCRAHGCCTNPSPRLQQEACVVTTDATLRVAAQSDPRY